MQPERWSQLVAVATSQEEGSPCFASGTGPSWGSLASAFLVSAAELGLELSSVSGLQMQLGPAAWLDTEAAVGTG